MILRWFLARHLPQEISLEAIEAAWSDGFFRGAVAASLAWVAVILVTRKRGS